MTTEYSAQALLDFLDYLAVKGLVKKGTVTARKAAVNNMLAVLDDSERADLRKLDVDVLSSRFSTLHGSRYSPQSLKEYRVRLRNSLIDFLRYKENPANFKVSTGQRIVLRKKPASPPVSAPSVANKAPENSEAIVSTFNVPIPVRPGVLVQLNGIPTDLTRSEATKIANVVMAMATSVEVQT
ncbi:MAG: hypothetical protein Q7T08_02195 [Devosia sp.]|nr:hypothetical protein [Devosia sp.]